MGSKGQVTKIEQESGSCFIVILIIRVCSESCLLSPPSNLTKSESQGPYCKLRQKHKFSIDSVKNRLK